MMQCLEWEPCRSFYQKIPAQPLQHDTLADQSGTSGLIDINLLADMTDPTLPPNPRKTVFYRLTVTQLIVVLATVVDELPPDSVMLIYLSDSGVGLFALWSERIMGDHIKFHHVDTVKSPPIINLLEVMGEFTPEQQRAFCQFVTDAPKLPPSGLAALNLKLTIIRKLINDKEDDANNFARGHYTSNLCYFDL